MRGTNRHAGPRSVAVLLMLACALLLAACGGDDGPDAARALTKREYIDRANALQVDASSVFSKVDGASGASPRTAAAQLDAFDSLISGYAELRPPRDWADEHEAKLAALATMRQSMTIVSRANARNTPVITRQLERFGTAQQEFQDAVRDINASR